ncbi:MAG: HAMP domain-containing histidine kinase [Eubacterium sp.]|nr:HAMP domain-containing histidine kinase [Eubacterium sp.]
MIKKLKKKFIALSMISLTLLLTVIVAGMNIINYSKVVNDADARLDVLEQNPIVFQDVPGRPEPPGRLFGRGGKGGRSMTQDEAEEQRFFTVVTDENGTVGQIDTSRISAVDEVQAEEYAEKVLAKGSEHGFVDEFRYSVRRTDSGSTVTFLDCGRVLGSFRDFLLASILMSLTGLLVVFLAISYFAGRIVKPVAESYEKQKRFITDAGHEIKTPLAIIKANLDVIKMDPDSTDESLKEIGNQVDRLAGLTDDLVYLSRMEEKKEGNAVTELPLSDVVFDTVSSFEVLAESSGRHVRQDIDPMIFIRGNVKDIEKLVSILMENAVKYSSGDDTIAVSLKRNVRDCVLQVVNRTDKPVTKESIDHIFDRFYRIDESRNSKTGGYGIGLSMADAIVTSCGGRISAEAGEGNRFIMKAVFPVLNDNKSITSE